MTVSRYPVLVEKFVSAVAEHIGLAFGKSKLADLESRLAVAAADFGSSSVEDFLPLVQSSFDSEDWLRLAQHLTVNETYFWRDHDLFDALVGQILPQLGTSGRLRIWCAGCSTGEEPYSLAIAVARAFPRSKDLDVRILATDISERNLDKARQGVYGPWSFRNVPDWLRDEYFTSEEGRLAVRSSVRSLVTFEQANLVSGPLPEEPMDLILCRNVLMYFSPETALLVGRRLSRCLDDSGWLAVSASEVSHPMLAQFVPVSLSGTVILKKTPNPPAVQVRPPLPVRATAAPARVFPVSASRPAEVRESLDRGRSAAALARCEDALAADRLNAELHCLRAIILLDMNRNEASASAFQRALYLDPHHVVAHYMLGSLRFRLGETESARKSFSTAKSLLEFWPDDEELSGADGLTAGDLRAILEHESLEV